MDKSVCYTREYLNSNKISLIYERLFYSGTSGRFQLLSFHNGNFNMGFLLNL